jgi:hypothetical protein
LPILESTINFGVKVNQMIERLIQKRLLPIFLFLFAFGLFVVNNWGVSIYMLDEAKNAECAREMFEQQEVFKPTFNYNLRKDKPPLHYFFMMASYSVFGVNEWAARFFSAIFGALTIMTTFIFTSRFLNRATAFWAAAVLLSSIHLNIQFHQAVPDPFLIFFFCLSLFLFYSALTTDRLFDKIGMYVLIGLAVLTKGPVAIVLPGLIFLLFLIFSNQLKWEIIRNLKPFLGIAIVLIVALPWFIVNGIQTNWEWTTDFFLKHNINRFSNEMEGHGGIFLVTFGYVIIGLLPFSLIFVQAFRQTWKERGNLFLLFCLIAGSTIILFFSVSQTKLPNYTVPAYPFLAILLANYLGNIQKTKSLHPVYIALFIVALALPIGCYFLVKSEPSLASIRPKIWWLLVVPAGVLDAYLHLLKKETEKSLLVITLTFILTSVLIFAVIFPTVDKTNPVQKSIYLLDGKEVAYYKKFNASYPFYLKKKIPQLEADGIVTYFDKNPDGVVISIKKEVDKIELPENCEVSFSCKDLFELPTTVLITRKH